ncbi:MAG: hypothetical protein JXB88_23670 [Spirochaetales bacterium]|nr:hypothetical protein [Spirochaetales bacterium]
MFIKSHTAFIQERERVEKSSGTFVLMIKMGTAPREKAPDRLVKPQPNNTLLISLKGGHLLQKGTPPLSNMPVTGGCGENASIYKTGLQGESSCPRDMQIPGERILTRGNGGLMGSDP